VRAWVILVEKWCKAMNQLKRGKTGPLIVFTQKERAGNKTSAIGQTLRAPAIEDYQVAKTAENGWLRFMTVDCQSDLAKFYVVVRDWDMATGNSRRVYRGCVETFDQVTDLQLKWTVNDQCVFVDARFETRRVYAECVKHGHWEMVKGRRVWCCWTGLMGSPSWDFAHHNEKDQTPNKTAPRKMYSRMQHGDPGAGQFKSKVLAPFMLWSNEQVKGVLARLRDGKGAKWTAAPVPPEEKETEAEYIRQINSEIRGWVKDRGTGRMILKWKTVSEKAANHYWDCECMQVVAADAAGCLGDSSESDNAPDGAEEDPK
jgi:hypothetical protein